MPAKVESSYIGWQKEWKDGKKTGVIIISSELVATLNWFMFLLFFKSFVSEFVHISSFGSVINEGL